MATNKKCCAICGSTDKVSTLVVRCGHREAVCLDCLTGKGLAGHGDPDFAEEMAKRFVSEECCRCQG